MKKKQIIAAVSSVLLIVGINTQAIIFAESDIPVDGISQIDGQTDSPEVFTISYDKNWGEGKIDQSAAVAAGDTVKLSVWALKRDGYSHVGWSDGEKLYKRGEQIEMPASDLELKAVWTRIYSLSYEDVSDLGYNWPLSNGTVVPGTEVKLGNYAAFKGDAMFGGWLVNGQHYDGGTSFIMPEQDTYVAVDWLDPINLIFFAGDVDGVVTEREQISKKYPGFDYDLPGATKMTRLGYNLSGWYDVANNKVYGLEKSFHIPEQDTVLEAIWSPITLALRFSANGGTGTMDKIKVKYDTVLNIPECLFSKEGYRLLGWKLRNDYYEPKAIVQAKIAEFGESPLFEAQWIEEGITPGDLNNDGICDLSDLAMLSVMLLDNEKFEDETMKNNADVLRDGTVDIADLSYYRQYIMKDKILLGMKKGEVN